VGCDLHAKIRRDQDSAEEFGRSDLRRCPRRGGVAPPVEANYVIFYAIVFDPSIFNTHIAPEPMAGLGICPAYIITFHVQNN
jgi:hypothetical protein